MTALRYNLIILLVSYLYYLGLELEDDSEVQGAVSEGSEED